MIMREDKKDQQSGKKLRENRRVGNSRNAHPEADDEKEIKHGVDPVSYTHLDVYKRQG